VEELETGKNTEAELSFRRIESEAAGFASVRLNMAMALARQGSLAEASIWVERHLELYPDDPLAVLRRRELRRALGELPAEVQYSN